MVKKLTVYFLIIPLVAIWKSSQAAAEFLIKRTL